MIGRIVPATMSTTTMLHGSVGAQLPEVSACTVYTVTSSAPGPGVTANTVPAIATPGSSRGAVPGVHVHTAASALWLVAIASTPFWVAAHGAVRNGGSAGCPSRSSRPGPGAGTGRGTKPV